MLGWATTAGLVAGAVGDAVLGDPRRGHPVAGFGQAATWLEHRLWAGSKPRGAVYTALAVGVPVVAAGAIEHLIASREATGSGRPAVTVPGRAVTRPTGSRRSAIRAVVSRAALTGVATWAVLGGRSLTREAEQLGHSLTDGDVDAARRRLPHLCGRDPASLDAGGLARATVESVAENTSDAVVAPLFWGAVGGLPGLVGYRAVNTLDAMVGHRSERYRDFGWAAARLDDAANYLPARLTGALTVLAAPLVGGRRHHAWQAWRRDAHRHPSPNAGVAEAAFAGALGRQLGGRTVYAYGVDERPRLGSGPPVSTPDIARATRLCWAVSAGTLACVVAARAVVAGARRARGRRR